MSEVTTAKESPVNILIVDDEARNLHVLEEVLGSTGYNLVRALTPEQALLLLLEGEFAAIVLDIQMPGMSGFELANLIKGRKRTQHVPIIFLTAYYQEDKYILEGYDTGAVDYLTKPINPQILKSKIGVFVDLYRKTRALAASNRALEQEVEQRQKAEEALLQANGELESRVEARTGDLLRLNEELALARDKALAASRAKDDFLARLSHELRTPLNPVLLLASDAASRTDLPEDVRSDFESIAQSAALEARLIDDLLDLTSIAHGKMSIDLRPFDVHAILLEALAMVEAEAAAKHLAVSIDLLADQHTVLCDDVRLKQVFWNVLKNAIKFTPEGGGVAIRTEVSGHGACLAVSIADTGIGMTPDEIGRIFETFSQGDHADEAGPTRFGGLGLGLAISRMMVERHSGTIHAVSAGRDQGTKFVIEVPLHVDETEDGGRTAPDSFAEGQATPLGILAHGRRKRILLVEDHAATRQALTQLLMRRHYVVVGATCLAEARTLARSETFDLLISDIGLPDGNGHELMAELREQKGMPGIALTGYGMEQDVERSRVAGFAAHLTKPVNVEALDGALSSIELGQGIQNRA